MELCSEQMIKELQWELAAVKEKLYVLTAIWSTIKTTLKLSDVIATSTKSNGDCNKLNNSNMSNNKKDRNCNKDFNK